MAVIRPEKAAKVAEIKELLTASKCTILVDFCGLTVAQDTAFRRKMREAGVKYGVVKNTMLRIAAKLVYSTVKLSTKLQLKLWQNFRRKKSSLQKCWAA